MSKQKRRDSFHRRRRFREERPAILIFCEGTTECNYFNNIKNVYELRNVTVKNTKKNQTGFDILIRETQRYESNGIYNDIYCVFDRDGRAGYEDIKQEMNKEGFTPVGSSPCFEYWFLLHFEYTDRPFLNCEAVQRQLKKYFPEYTKNLPDIYARLKNKTSIAIKHANQARCAAEDIATIPSITDVDELVQKIIPDK